MGRRKQSNPLKTSTSFLPEEKNFSSNKTSQDLEMLHSPKPDLINLGNTKSFLIENLKDNRNWFEHSITKMKSSLEKIQSDDKNSLEFSRERTSTPLPFKNNSDINDSPASLKEDSDLWRRKPRDEVKIQPYLNSNGEEVFFCPLCQQTDISTRAQLTQHLQIHQSVTKRDDGKHICCFCASELSSNSSLERHLLTHTNHRPFVCVHCDKAFTTNGNLSRHMRTSHGQLKVSFQDANKSESLSMEEETLDIPDGKTDSVAEVKSSAFTPQKPVEGCMKFPIITPNPLNSILSSLQQKFYSMATNSLLVPQITRNPFIPIPTPIPSQVNPFLFSSEGFQNAFQDALKKIYRPSTFSCVDNEMLTNKLEPSGPINLSKERDIQDIKESFSPAQTRWLIANRLKQAKNLLHLKQKQFKRNKFKIIQRRRKLIAKERKLINGSSNDEAVDLSFSFGKSSTSLESSEISPSTKYSVQEHSEISNAQGSHNSILLNCSSSVLDSFESSTPISKNGSDQGSSLSPSIVPIANPYEKLANHGLLNISPPAQLFVSQTNINNNVFSPSNITTISSSIDKKASPGITSFSSQNRKKNSYKDAPKLISCPVPGCKQKFPWNSSLKRHILTHTPHKPFACTRCSKSFSTKSNRERHMERVHRINLKRTKSKGIGDLFINRDISSGLSSEASLGNDELTGEELISMSSNDRHAEDISNHLLQTAGSPKVEPNPGRLGFMNRPPKQRRESPKTRKSQEHVESNIIPTSEMLLKMMKINPILSLSNTLIQKPEQDTNAVFKISSNHLYKCPFEPCKNMEEFNLDRVQILKHFMDLHPVEWAQMTVDCKFPSGLPRIFEILHRAINLNHQEAAGSSYCPLCVAPCKFEDLAIHFQLIHNCCPI